MKKAIVNIMIVIALQNIGYILVFSLIISIHSIKRQLRITAKEETQGSSIGAGYLKIYTLYIDYQENERIKLYFRK
ncbi:hypothetical protein RhiirA4_482386 [Rhizophagus irregularis]|uniref:Uncharacterized protein n=1 Tax=Rhizophagus irregularis TaxID=588596 RepID=A0A2I1HL10_9GLOM|nr:hypothetical protein RhiirA4_482386 [Rhizophagus irregularis]